MKNLQRCPIDHQARKAAKEFASAEWQGDPEELTKLGALAGLDEMELSKAIFYAGSQKLMLNLVPCFKEQVSGVVVLKTVL